MANENSTNKNLANEEIKEQTQEDINKLEKAKLDKFNELLAENKNPFLITKYDVTNHSMDIKNNFDEYNEKTVSLAGRLMLKRVMGKASLQIFKIEMEIFSFM